MRHPVALVDAFADRPFAGNPAEVMVLEAPLAPDLMQAVARELAQAETAFAVAREGGAWDLRWFSPAREADVCGHATPAAAHVLAQASARGGRLGAALLPDRARLSGRAVTTLHGHLHLPD